MIAITWHEESSRGRAGVVKLELHHGPTPGRDHDPGRLMAQLRTTTQLVSGRGRRCCPGQPAFAPYPKQPTIRLRHEHGPLDPLSELKILT
jgi:hypothetical protein